ncbi:ATP-binding SpoIIE family protein phosphatase [Tichowtungia aerotolerans]|uniref:Response regulator n=1 Tax=Tichowtungia aerotolerans TaxID=2697043 RepID=A0A6P1M2Y7_9BACT|nr:response regulator [Tichowtungia aerotolerans]QHI68197.1 response regulator [Tichowtungia aerotolerans]
MSNPLADQALARSVPDFSRGGLGGTVLVVDDELPNRLYLKKLLSSYGCEVLMAPDGPTALETVHIQRPDLVLADVVMPNMDGFELCGAIKELSATRDIPVIMVTAKGHIDDLKKGFDLGAMDYIRKPFDARELVLRVGNALALKRSREALARWKRRMSHELELAGAIQQSMFSDTPFFSKSFEIRVKYKASMDIGGDAFDVLDLPDGRCCVYLADVSGHGVAPAMISSMLKASATELISSFYERGPAYICNELHVRLCAAINNPAYYATMFMALYEPIPKRWVCMNCGHPDPILVCGEKQVPFPAGGGGIPVGLALGPDRPYDEGDQTILEHCEKLKMLLYTDGLSEATHHETGEECGEENLRRFFSQVLSDSSKVEKPEALLDLIESENYAVGSDDCTAVVIRMTESSSVLLETEIPVDMDSVSMVCEKMEELVLTHEEEDIAARIRLVAMEHAMNVVEHSGLDASSAIWTQLLMDGCDYRLIFSDAGREWDHALAESVNFELDQYAEGGRGLAITNVAADFVERYRRDSRNVVSYLFRRQSDS